MSAASAWGAYLFTVIGVFGLLIGSFLNVVIYRVPAGKSLIPASRCPKCDAAIRPWQNVPVFSWLLLRGRCGSCADPISVRYPLVELGTALAFLGVAWWWAFGGFGAPQQTQSGGAVSVLTLLAYLYLAAVSIVLALIDLDTFRLPDAIVLPSVVVLTVLAGASAVLDADGTSLLRAVLGAAALGFFYGLLWFFWPGGMGFGDVKLALLLGFALGWQGWGALVVGGFAAFCFGGVFGVLLMVVRHAGRKSRIPFGPWMILGAWFGIVFGEPISRWYLSLLGAA